MPAPPVLLESATGRYSRPVVRCAQLLASCAEVQAMLGAATAALALDAIDFPLRDVETYGPPLPGIIVEPLISDAGYNGDQRGKLQVTFFDVIDTDYARAGDTPIDFKNDLLAWMNRLGLIWSQMRDQSKAPMSAFGGERFDAIRWRDVHAPTHAYDELDGTAAAVWFRVMSIAVEWTT